MSLLASVPQQNDVWLVVLVPLALLAVPFILRLLFWAIAQYRSLPKDKGKAFQYLFKSVFWVSPCFCQRGGFGFAPDKDPRNSRASKARDPWKPIIVYGRKGDGFRHRGV